MTSKIYFLDSFGAPAWEPATDHESAAGALCTGDGTGCCGTCGVAMTTCEACKGIGYHRELCPESDETTALGIVRGELATLLERSDLVSFRHALERCETELLAALRTLGFAGRDDLSDVELASVLTVLRPTLRRIAADTDEVGP